MIKKILGDEKACFVICAGIYNVISTLLNWALLKIGVHYLICTTAGYISGVLLAYLLNTKYVFKKEYSINGFIKFISVYISNYFITMVLTWILVDALKINAYLAPILCIGFGMVYNFTLSKLFVYKDKTK